MLSRGSGCDCGRIALSWHSAKHALSLKLGNHRRTGSARRTKDKRPTVYVRRLLKSLSLVALLAVSSAPAQASSISFNLVNVNSTAGTLTGTIDIDTATRLVTAADISMDDPSGGFPIFTTIASTAASNGLTASVISGPSTSPHNSGAQLALYFDDTNLGLGNLSICLIGGSCGLYGSPGSYAQIFLSSSHDGPFYLTSGELNLVTPSTPAAAPTSEPSSLLLLGTGIAGCAAMMARMASRRAASGT